MIEDAGDDVDDSETSDDEQHSSPRTFPAVLASDIEKELDPGLDLAAFVEGKEKEKKAKVKHETNVEPVDYESMVNGNHARSEDVASLEAHIHRSKRVNHVTSILGVLARHHYRFVRRTTTEGEKVWRVHFGALSNTLIQLEIERLITARFGPLATLIVRHLCSMGKIDEKTIASACILQVKDVRAALSAMQASSLVETQEVPKDTMRMPSKTIFLWYFDRDRCRRLLLNDSYKLMSRLLQRLQVEKEKVHSVLEKADRSDVRGNEHKYLSVAEQAALSEWEHKKAKIWTHVIKLDSTVAVLRDFLPPKML